MLYFLFIVSFFFFFQAEDGIRDSSVTGVQTCALPIYFKRLDSRPFLPAPFEIRRPRRWSPASVTKAPSPESRCSRHRPPPRRSALGPLSLSNLDRGPHLSIGLLKRAWQVPSRTVSAGVQSCPRSTDRSRPKGAGIQIHGLGLTLCDFAARLRPAWTR